MNLRLLHALAIFVVAPGFLPAEEPRDRPLAEPPLTDLDRGYWAYRKPMRPALPAVRNPGWVVTPVDSFILGHLEPAGLKPAPPAERATLLRRVNYDLIGLPPTPEELDAFLDDPRPDAYERVVERLLASPQHGERWAQHWLDVVRYAESNGYEADGERPHAWRYRDYVISAFNSDKPYDRFAIEQIAGDELAAKQPAEARTEMLIAAGFNRCGPVHLTSGNTDPEVNRLEVLTEMTTGVGSAFLGLTFGCARCPDHKFDPISQGDYYRLQSFFAAAQPREVDISRPEEHASKKLQEDELNARLAPLRKQVAQLETPYRARLTDTKKARLEPVYLDALAIEPKKRTPEQQKLAGQAEILLKITWDELLAVLTPEDRARRAALRAEIHVLEAQRPPPPAHAWTIADENKVPPTFVLKRGDPKRKLAEVFPAFPRVLCDAATESDHRPAKSDHRLALARWLTQPEHPLTARAMVNRIWQHHFGRGLVGTPNDFGSRGERPSHPQLLDWLAVEFVSHGWSIKHLHRVMVLSNTYRQSSQVKGSDEARKVDPENRLLWRMNRQRLEGETLRDGLLAVAGRLNLQQGGPMVRVPLEPEVYELIFTEGEPDGLWPVTPNQAEHTRRSIYLFAKRNVRLPLFQALDQPDRVTSCPVRPVSTFAPQALILLNGPFFQEQSKALALRLLRECGQDTTRQIDRAYRLALGRPPKLAEIQLAIEFLTAQGELLRDRLRCRQPVPLVTGVPRDIDPAVAAALADFCLALVNSNEFLYIP